MNGAHDGIEETLWLERKTVICRGRSCSSGVPIPNSSYAWMSNVSPLDAFMSVKMGTFREFQLYMVW